MPDIAVVLCNRAVTGEEASLGDIDQALAAPTQRVAGIIRQSLALAHHISVEIGQGLEPGFDLKSFQQVPDNCP